MNFRHMILMNYIYIYICSLIHLISYGLETRIHILVYIDHSFLPHVWLSFGRLFEPQTYASRRCHSSQRKHRFGSSSGCINSKRNGTKPFVEHLVTQCCCIGVQRTRRSHVEGDYSERGAVVLLRPVSGFLVTVVQSRPSDGWS